MERRYLVLPVHGGEPQLLDGPGISAFAETCREFDLVTIEAYHLGGRLVLSEPTLVALHETAARRRARRIRLDRALGPWAGDHDSGAY